MNNSLLEPRKRLVAVYMRVATKEQLLSPARNVKANQTNRSYVMAKQLMEPDYKGRFNVHSVIKEHITTSNELRRV